MARFRNVNWSLPGKDNDPTVTNDTLKMAVALDLRDEMQALTRIMRCPNVMAGFVALQSIDKTLKRIDKRLAKKTPLREPTPATKE